MALTNEQVTDTPNPEGPQSTEGSPQQEENPGAAYKGLQRVVAAKDREIERLRKEMESRGSSGSDEAIRNMVVPVLQRLAEEDPERAREMATAIAQRLQAQKLAELERRANSQREVDELARIEARNKDALKQMVADLGVDPDSDLIDYGDQTMVFAERMSMARETAREAAKLVKPKQVPSGNATNSAQPGTPPAPPAKDPTYSSEDWQAALLAYQRNPNAANMATLKRIRDARDAMLGAGLT